MKTKQLLVAAFMLPMAFAACTNEEIAEIQNPQLELGSEEIVGERLIADGAVINLFGGSESRVTNHDFDENDKLGLAWFNNPAILGETILQKQHTTNFTNAVNEIYGNYLVQKNMETGDFEVNGQLYAGSYFIYYPYQKISQGGQLVADYSKYIQKNKAFKPSTSTFDFNEYMTNAFNVSHRMILKEGGDDFILDINAAPLSVMNSLIVRPTLVKEGEVYNAAKDLLSSIKINSVSITADKNVFSNKATLDVTKLAAQVGKTWDKEKTQAAVKESIITGSALVPTYGKTIATTVDYVNSFADEVLSDIFTYTFMTDASAGDVTKLTITVKTNVADFVYTCVDEGILNVLNTKFNSAIGGGKVVPMELDLNTVEFHTKSISTPADWNLLMKLHELQGDDVTVTVKNLTFTEEEPMYLPENINVTVNSGKIIFASGSQIIGNEFTTKGDLTVNAGATLTLNADVAAGSLTNNGTTNINAVLTTDKFVNADEAVINITENNGIKEANTAAADYTNNGVINADGNIVGEVSNTDGIINVTFGASIVDHDGNGIIHGVLDAENNDAIKNAQVEAIWRMIGTNTDVNCNSLELIGFEIAIGDEYNKWGGENYSIAENSFDGKVVKLVNSSLKKGEATAPTFEFEALDLDASTIEGSVNVNSGFIAASETENGSVVDGNIDAATIVAEALTAKELDATSVELTASTIEGKITATGEVELTASAVTGDVEGTLITIDGGSVEGTLSATGLLTITNANVTIPETNVATSEGLVATGSNLVGEFNAGSTAVVLTNGTFGKAGVESSLETSDDITINANDEVVNIIKASVNAANLTFKGKKNVMLQSSDVTVTGTCYVQTIVKGKTLKNETKPTITASDYQEKNAYIDENTIEKN